MSGPIVGRFEIGDFCWVQPVDLNERCSMFALHDAVILGGQWKVHCIAMLHCWNILPLTNAGALAVKAGNEVSTPKLHERTKTPFWTTFTFFFFCCPLFYLCAGHSRMTTPSCFGHSFDYKFECFNAKVKYVYRNLWCLVNSYESCLCTKYI